MHAKEPEAHQVAILENIKPETLKAVNMYGVRCLTRVCKVACRTGQAPKQWQTSVIIPIHKKRDKRKCTNYRGISLIIVPGKVYAKCLEKKCRKIFESKLTDAQWVFVLVEAQWTRSSPLRSRGNMQMRSMHVVLILKKYMIAFLETNFGRCCYSMALVASY